MPVITPQLVSLDRPLGATKDDVIRTIAGLVAQAGRASDADALATDVLAREALTPTGMGGGIAIPHAKTAAVTEPGLFFARLAPTVDFGAPDGPADILFMILAPEGAADTHLQVLSRLAGSLVDDEFTAALRSASTPEEVVALVDAAVADREEAAATVAADARSLVAVTACPTGIAHTYMAADALKAAGDRAGVRVTVETQGSAGSKPLDPAIIAAAEAVIFAVDVDVRDKGRFAGKPVVQVPVKKGIDEADALVVRALAAANDPSAPRVAGGAAAASAAPAANESFGALLKRVLLTGVSYMIPFVAGGGLLLALGFLMGGFEIAFGSDVPGQNVAQFTALNFQLWNLPPEGFLYYLGCVAFTIGGASMAFLVPALAGYIAYGLADRPGIAPGFVAGSIAGFMGAGFLGGIVGGLLAGVVARWMGTWNVPRWLAGLMPVVLIPLLASIVASGLMVLVLGGPIAALSTGLGDFLNSLTGTGVVLLGVILGAMMAIDLGGPINKVAYSFAVANLANGSPDNPGPWMIMAAVMAAGMVPPLAMALATVLDRRLFSAAERENGKAAWLLGASFISEGAIPFAAADPLRVIGASIVGAAATGAISMAAGVTSQAPHGGIFVFFAIGNIAMFIVAIAVGVIITALLVIALKRWVRRTPIAVEERELATV
ncbi:PTS fructose transporter subunit IIABC [Agrococcus jejuensis]|uniref:PTS system D-fructose-specific IIA component (F1P-forming), Frc family /PTS system D-fructose-specific IIB component (F1P-forming), Frc family /PTS system D-fructose-specific IIC component (F1P-for... n=1 Tax=Agrococcus jejuensis TaxID=399736 RepID=A0A1G7ZXS2_9MICO|nr:fructose-specific PTS transporter subunit EIIC [Agrococcus jejuensis]SDH13411.1 PTS system D-fructose-specific IIA component (F1P-forming), Frc family /PTS system D-fructose-specific IIB component (F1P-forming), Frc family /PTS system D-fructose-specific IIC component (F1P-forming), Frc family [Agrococcus jejuensis]